MLPNCSLFALKYDYFKTTLIYVFSTCLESFTNNIGSEI